MVDKKKIAEAIRLFLEGIGDDPNREGLKCFFYLPLTLVFKMFSIFLLLALRGQVR
ncbi:MAG: hypothetical protein H3C25_11015 [Candidatus Brocadia sapporoensis]|nr:hypothetical protein [Candidatus Brocadia sapporoensis]